jgi:hypothetical protein
MILSTVLRNGHQNVQLHMIKFNICIIAHDV